jgi:hypothetical protein
MGDTAPIKMSATTKKHAQYLAMTYRLEILSTLSSVTATAFGGARIALVETVYADLRKDVGFYETQKCGNNESLWNN